MSSQYKRGYWVFVSILILSIALGAIESNKLYFQDPGSYTNVYLNTISFTSADEVYLTVEHSGPGTLEYSNDYRLQRKTGESWEDYPTLPENMTTDAQVCALGPKGRGRVPVYVGHLEPGVYMLIMTLEHSRIDSAMTYYLEFEVIP